MRILIDSWSQAGKLSSLPDPRTGLQVELDLGVCIDLRFLGNPGPLAVI
jgi:hypothetical protein